MFESTQILIVVGSSNLEFDFFLNRSSMFESSTYAWQLYWQK